MINKSKQIIQYVRRGQILIEKEKPELHAQTQGRATCTERDRGGGQGTPSGGRR